MVLPVEPVGLLKVLTCFVIVVSVVSILTVLVVHTDLIVHAVFGLCVLGWLRLLLDRRCEENGERRGWWLIWSRKGSLMRGSLGGGLL